MEKPDAETAQRYLASGEYLWNSGIFIMRASGCAGVGAVLPLDAGWSDVGARDALWEIGAKDGDGNALTGMS